MAVFTSITEEELKKFLSEFNIGDLISFEGITAGIENSNFFVYTTKGEFVLTIFEILKVEQLPYYIEFMLHLAIKGLPVPKPQRNKSQELICILKGKPAIIATKQKGKHVIHPNALHCSIVANVQAQMHIASRGFTIYQENFRGLSWWTDVYPKLKPFLNADQNSLYESTLKKQIEIQNSEQWSSGIPKGACHCDLFRDNVLIINSESDSPSVGGVIDFYFSGVDTFIFDIAVALNDWCIDRSTGELDFELAQVWLDSYSKVRPFEPLEAQLWPYALQAAALRFWSSRLYDFYLPRDAQNLKPHDPTHFERILIKRLTENIISLPL
ncbi:homoserine kinase [Taylorella equigenitalis]|uniref:Homoserine kinase n=1 Tax=Taylorella equigenitalis (strain MCE9) TaxID=937774 RepID=A0A654KJ81_TAYEM|nr:homoserine kinase [Taylorella equigenitalis]ADU92404.1 Homoserine kinase [Taylorella equigenitalis MCE9]ASY40886.1 homoserine kinase [Taylorella equigenitalis]WDU55694.1 homoserine kinase [Taylorella equigenitalis]